ncbi:TauD/TfdA family dioxygenase [Komagataeibacter rhaeticus]|nr:TauD/TfdA family dioxygenase [Komagataeibacter rhaeticus]
MNAADIQIRPLTCRIGAEISGVDLSRSIDADVFRILHDALMKHLVIFFRDQDITHEDHLRFGRLFGDLAIHSGVAGLPDYPEIVAIHADGRSKFVAGENWHSDLSCNECPHGQHPVSACRAGNRGIPCFQICTALMKRYRRA